jgi:hypothetical protein
MGQRCARRRIVLVGLAAIIVLPLASVALAARPRGNANYIAVDKQGRPAITLWMRTGTTMFVFACYRWGKIDHGDHLNNVNPIQVPSTGSFSYHGPAGNLHGKKVTIKLSGKFVTRDRAVGKLTAPCAKDYSFTASFAP